MLLFFNILFEFIVFQQCLIPELPFMGKMDELLTILFFYFAIIELIAKRKKKVLYKIEGKIIILMTMFIFVGILSTLVNKVQTNNIAIYKDILAISKFIILYISTIILSCTIDKDLLLRKISKRSRVYIKIIFIFALINLIVDIDMSSGIRYGLRSYCFLFPHPTYLVSSMVILLSVIIADYKPTDKKIIMEGAIVLILTFRSKALVLLLGCLLISIVIKLGKEIKIKHILITGIIGFAFTYEKIAYVLYYGLTAARPALYIVGYKLANRYFPLGSGFGSFASSLSGEYYSKIYYEYGINTVMGLRPDSYEYMADTFWPYIYGQFGIIGLILFISIIVYIYKSIKTRYSNNKNCIIASTIILMYILIASVAEAVFTDTTGSFLFVILATYLGYDKLSSTNNESQKSEASRKGNKKCLLKYV